MKKSILAFAEELKRAAILDIPFVIIHPGSHCGDGIISGLKRCTYNLDSAIELSETEKITVLLETTSGQGTSLGSNFEELAFILERSKYQKKLGICVDTAHIFAAGYDLRDKKAYNNTFDLLEKKSDWEKYVFFI